MSVAARVEGVIRMINGNEDYPDRLTPQCGTSALDDSGFNGTTLIG